MAECWNTISPRYMASTIEEVALGITTEASQPHPTRLGHPFNALVHEAEIGNTSHGIPYPISSLCTSDARLADGHDMWASILQSGSS